MQDIIFRDNDTRMERRFHSRNSCGFHLLLFRHEEITLDMKYLGR